MAVRYYWIVIREPAGDGFLKEIRSRMARGLKLHTMPSFFANDRQNIKSPAKLHESCRTLLNLLIVLWQL